MNETTRTSELEKAERTLRRIGLGLVLFQAGWVLLTAAVLLVAPSPLALVANAVANVAFAVTLILS